MGDARDVTSALTTRASIAPRPALRIAIESYGAWLVVVALFLVLPLALPSGTALTMMGLIGISIVFALSYNMLLGQTGMLSFGHAVYFGFGAYFAVHAMNAAIASDLMV